MSTTKTRPNWAYSEADLILKADAPREDWLKARQQGIGGSDVSAITGLSKWSSAYQVWLDKIGEAPEVEENMAMRMGNLLEPIVVQLFNEDHGIATRRLGLVRSKANPFMQVTVDRLTEDGGILECKTSNGWLSHEWEDDQVPDHAELQVQHGLAVTGRSHAWVAGLLDGRNFFVRRIDRDQELIDQLIEIERRFWEDHVLTSEAPAVTRVDLEMLKDKYAVAAEAVKVTKPTAELKLLRTEYEAARDAEKAAKEAKDAAAAKVREILGEADTLVNEEGASVFTLKQNGAFSASRFEKNHPQIAKDFMVPTEILAVDKIKENYPDLHLKHRARVIRTPKLKTA